MKTHQEDQDKKSKSTNGLDFAINQPFKTQNNEISLPSGMIIKKVLSEWISKTALVFLR